MSSVTDTPDVHTQEKSSAGCLTEPEEPPSPPPLSPTAADVGPDVRAAEQSPQRRAAQSPYAAEAREGDPPPSRAQRVQNWLFKAGDTILHGMEFVGEVVAGVLGIDESKYQDIYDSMTDEELAEARRVNDLRNAEYEAWVAAHPELDLSSDETSADTPAAIALSSDASIGDNVV